MKQILSRRRFVAGVASASAALVMPSTLCAAPRQRKIHIGHTGITWKNSDVEQAIQTVASLGFYGFETFGDVLNNWQEKGSLAPVLETNKIPLISAYCTVNLTDATKRSEEMEKAKKWCGLIKACNGKIFVLGPNGVKRDSYDFAANKSNIVATLNEVAKLVEQEGLTPVLHQHTGTCVESRDETYAVLEAVDTRHLKFGPDVGQLTKGGQDAVKVVKDFLPIVQHMHLKDYNGKDEHLLGYCPLGQGKVDIPAILDMMEGRTISGMVMVELDNDFKSPTPVSPAALVTQSRDYLRSIGVRFRV